jgi:hypothetical protein
MIEAYNTVLLAVSILLESDERINPLVGDLVPLYSLKQKRNSLVEEDRSGC